jgi:ABC-type multidrug transport system fused ATPase/permease subunit
MLARKAWSRANQLGRMAALARVRFGEAALRHSSGGKHHTARQVLKDAMREAVDSLGSIPWFGGRDRSDAKAEVDRDSLRRFLMLAWPERRLVGASVATIAITSPVMLVLPTAIGNVLDVALASSTGGGGSMTPQSLVVGLGALFALQAVLIGARSGMLSVAGERIATRLRIDTFRALTRQDMGWFDQQSTGDLVNRLSADATVVQKALTTQVAAFLRHAAMAVGSTGLLVWLSPLLAGVSLAAIPPLVVLGRGFGRYMKSRQERVQKQLGESLKVAEGVVSGLRTVRAFSGEHREVERFADTAKAALEQARRVGIAQAGFDGMLHWSTNLALLAVLGLGGHLVQSGAMTAGELTSFLMYSLYAGFNVAGLGQVWAEWQRGVGAARRLFSILDRQPSMPSVVDWTRPDWSKDVGIEGVSGWTAAIPAPEDLGHRAPTPPGGRPMWFAPAASEVRGSVRFEDVQFAYPTRPDATVLDGFTLALEPGRNTALVGASGSGKSTVAALLCRMYDPQGGRVLVDDVDVREWSPAALRGAAVGLVEQQPRLLGGSVRDTIAYGLPTATDEAVELAARAANAHEFVMAFPNRYDTLVGEGGQQLSGGQRARVALSRVLLLSPPIVILDEASAALDARSEALVSAAVSKATQGRTVLTIAHRLSTMRAADAIAVLKNGRVVETGTFEALSHDSGSELARLLASQLGPLSSTD